MKICTNKNCKFAKQKLPISYFGKNKKARDGLHNWCRQCVSEHDRQYRKTHKKEITLRHKIYWGNRLKYDLGCKLGKNLRTRLGLALRNNAKAGSAVNDLGCSIKEFKNYIESKFQLGMCWGNYGNGPGKWNLDHVIPLSKIDLTNRIQFLRVCHYTNMQPLWWSDNMKKGNKLSCNIIGNNYL